MPEAPPAEAPKTAAPDAPPSGAPAVQSIDSVYSDFDAIEAAESTPRPAPAQKKEAAPPRPTQSENASSAASTQDRTQADDTSKKEDTSSASNATSDGTSPKPVKAAELRNAYENLKREHKALQAEHERIRKAPQDNGRVKQLEELLDSERAARKKAEDVLKVKAYEEHPEFVDKWQKPMDNAWSLAHNDITQLTVVEKKNEMDEIIRPSRPATAEDFNEIAVTQDTKKANALARELFGDDANVAIDHRNRIRMLWNARNQALKEHRDNLDKYEKEQSEARTRQEQEQSERAKAQAETFKKLVDEGVKAHPELFTPTEGDDESASILQRGQVVADSLFSGVNPKTGRPYTPDGLVKFHAFVRNAVAAHGHILHKLKAAETKVAELESDLAEYKQSGSSADSGRGEAAKSGSLAGDEEFDALDAKDGRRW